MGVLAVANGDPMKGSPFFDGGVRPDPQESLHLRRIVRQDFTCCGIDQNRLATGAVVVLVFAAHILPVNGLVKRKISSLATNFHVEGGLDETKHLGRTVETEPLETSVSVVILERPNEAHAVGDAAAWDDVPRLA
jgi:hypothetical protein